MTIKICHIASIININFLAGLLKFKTHWAVIICILLCLYTAYKSYIKVYWEISVLVKVTMYEACASKQKAIVMLSNTKNSGSIYCMVTTVTSDTVTIILVINIIISTM
jgi:hypothetical protein